MPYSVAGSGPHRAKKSSYDLNQEQNNSACLSGSEWGFEPWSALGHHIPQTNPSSGWIFFAFSPRDGAIAS
jgi:hypothetical protein